VAGGTAAKLGQEYDPGIMAEPGEDELVRIIDQFAAVGLTASIGG